MPFVRAAPLVILSCFWAGCVGDPSAYSIAPAITLLSADPSTFLGAVRCGVPGGVQRYVVTLRDVGPQFRQEMSMPSSEPTPCSELVSFTPLAPPLDQSPPSLIRNDYYVARIQGYDRDDIVPRDGAGSGTEKMIDPVTAEPVLPRWTTGCGMATDTGSDAAVNPLEFPTQVLASIEVFLHGCLPFEAIPATDAGADGDPTGEQPDGAREGPSPPAARSR
jgi:hypothetical protein